MNTTICHIEFLVSAHNCVVIPGLGAILAHRQSAQISADASTIIPPKRVYTFNGSLTQTDGLVERSIARSLNISYERAAAIVASDVDTMRHQLANDNSLSLGRVGTLENDADGNTQFTAFDSDALTPAANWLQTVSVNKIKVDHITQAIAERNRNGRRLSPVAKFMRVAAAAVVLAIVAFASSTPISIEDANYAAIALPEVKAPTHEFVPSTKTPVLEIRHDASEENVLVDTAARYAYQRQQKLRNGVPTATELPTVTAQPTDEKAPAATQTQAAKQAPAKSTAMPAASSATAVKSAPAAATTAGKSAATSASTAKTASAGKSTTAESASATKSAASAAQVAASAPAVRINDSDDYCVIIASVANAAEADQYIADAKRKYNENCALLHNDGRYRIYVATAPSSAAAHKIISSTGIAKRHPGAWVCARR